MFTGALKDQKLPPVAFGTWSWGVETGNNGKTVFGNTCCTEEELKPVFDLAFEKGYTFWDTAYVYDFGGAERLLAACAGGRPFFLSDKFTPLPDAKDGEVRKTLSGSLARMGRDHIDLYWIHTPADVERWTKEVIPLLSEGLIRHIGVSNHSLEDIEFAQTILQSAGFTISAVQNHCSLIYRNSIRSGVLNWCNENNALFMPYMVLEQGALTQAYSAGSPFPPGCRRAKAFPPETLEKLAPLIELMKTMGEKHGGADASQIAVAWAICRGMLPIVGATRPRHVEKAIGAAAVKLDEYELMDLEMAADRTGVSVRAGWEKEM